MGGDGVVGVGIVVGDGVGMLPGGGLVGGERPIAGLMGLALRGLGEGGVD